MSLAEPPRESQGDQLSWQQVVLRVAVFVAFAALGALFSALLPVMGTLPRSVLFTFSAGALGNAIPVRIFEHARLADFGLGWRRESWPARKGPAATLNTPKQQPLSTATRLRSADCYLGDLLRGLGLGAAAAAAVLFAMLLFNWSHFEKTGSDTAGAVLLTTALLAIGAAGEEMMFHGYAFRVLVRQTGPFATILPVGLLFGVMHLSNQNSTLLGVFNTALWGVLLGYACYHTGALWMPIGMHFGWNALLPLAGANLSGFTIRVIGYALEPTRGGVLTGGAYGPEGSVLATLAAAVLFWMVGRTPEAEAPQ